ncbi:hypothetical protein [Rhodocaloribacter sp.]
MSLSFGLSPWLLVLCLLGAAGLTYWTYRRTSPPLSTGRRALLSTLRFLALFLLLFLLFEPILRRITREEKPPVLAVLVDESQSLGLRHTGEEGPDLDLPATVREALRRLPREDLGGTMKVFAFSSDVEPLPGDRLDSLAFEGVRTNIARALDYVRDALKDENLRGVVLISDGQYNTGRNPLYLAERYPVPIYAVAVGDTTARRDVQVRRITTNEIAYMDTELPVQVGLRVEDYPGERVTVTLSERGRTLATQTVELPRGTAEIPVDLSYTPEAEGLHRLRVSVSRLPGEATYRNNAEAFTVRVLKNKRRILVLAPAPSPDLAALRQLLDADAHMEVLVFVQKSRGAFYGGTPPPSFDDFDLILLAGYPGPEADAAVIARVTQAAESGVPLLFLLSRRTDLRRLQNRFTDLLPVVPRVIRRGFVEAAFVPTPQGEHHPILDVPEVPLPMLRRLPPLVYGESRWQPAPDARVLASVEVRGVPLSDPLLVVRRRGKNRSAALLGAGTWRWKNVPEALDEAAPFWPKLLENLIQWVATREDTRLVRVQPVENLFGGGEAVTFTGQVYDESFNPVDDASVEVEVTAPDGGRFPYIMKALGNGRYLLDAGALPEGTYRYTARARRDGVDLGEDTGAFAVGALTLEFKETRANTALMRQIADRSGGSFFLPREVGSLPTRLAASGTFTPVTVEREREIRLWRRYTFLAIVIVLLTAEWFFRKRSGMV